MPAGSQWSGCSAYFCMRIVAVLLILLSIAWSEVSADQPSSFPLADVVKQQAARLAALENNADAIGAFTTSIGPAIGLRDAAGTLAAKTIPPQMAQELRVADLTLSVQRLMAALAAWQLAETVTQAVEPASTVDVSSLAPSPTREEWLKANGPPATLPDMLRLVKPGGQLASPLQNETTTELALA